MTASSTNPIAQLKTGETQLVAQITRATDLVDQIATGNLDLVIARFEASVRAAQVRLANAMATVRRLGGELLADLQGDSTALTVAIDANSPLELPALPVPTDDTARVDRIETHETVGNPPKKLSDERSPARPAEDAATPYRRNGTRRK